MTPAMFVGVVALRVDNGLPQLPQKQSESFDQWLHACNWECETIFIVVLDYKRVFNELQVLWEVYSAQIAGIMPELRDLLFLANVGSRLQSLDLPVMGNHRAIAYNFTGTEGNKSMEHSMSII